MPRATATRELPASREAIWAIIAEPRRFAEWWPRVAVVRPDRLGLAEGSRWAVESTERPPVFRRSGYSGATVVHGVEPHTRFDWEVTGSRIGSELRLEDADAVRSRAVPE